MERCRPITRRESIKRLLELCGSLALGSFLTVPVQKPLSAWAGVKKTGFIVEGMGVNETYTERELVRNVFDAAGGMSQFVSKGDVVVIKPNISWAKPPHLAATTNPEVLQAVIELCQEAGAGKVRIADNTIEDAGFCFKVTGAEAVAKKTGAELIYPTSSLMRNMNLHGHRLGVWPVFVPLVEADKVINLPVAKHHILSSLTLGMKGWIGAVGGRRGSLHLYIHENIVDLAQFFKPTITLIDATKIMIRNGPFGGSTSDVADKNTLILSDDPVAADAKASLLFGKRPQDIGFIRVAQKWGLGTYDFKKLVQKEVKL
ncbi:MAG: DUF362 domain-containing protein [Deltaproteobacteria bacterium]|nr:DUF362 domain-containing protein [Deltaproteobacteria bacterium]NIW16149.1 DUF362 domain-containing protein [Candidatus Bathyarchaeota archaeon]